MLARMRGKLIAWCVFALTAGCGGDDDASDVDGGGGADAAAATDAGPPDASPCPRTPRPENAARRVVVSHPYDAAGTAANSWEVLDLSPAGELSRPGVTFEMGRSTLGTVAFTADGEVGVVAQSDGSLGVFRFDGDGAPQVVHAAYEGAFYAEHVVPAADGSRMFVLDPNWRENGGGLYSIAIGCDGSITGEALVAAAKSPGALVRLPGGDVVLWSDDVLASPAGDDAHRLSLASGAELRGGADAFGDDEAIVASGAATFDGRFALAGDTSQFSGVDTRVAVVDVTGAGLTATQVLTPIEDPIAIATSPFDDAAIVASGFGDAVFVLDYSPDATPPFTVRGELAYDGASPQLPGHAVTIARGDLRGMVLIAENVGVRQIQFAAGATVTDLGMFGFGSGLDNISGAIGVQP
jgi:hypothetical protein